MSQKTLRAECPSWDTALQAIFDNYLPYKFAYCQHVGLTDITSTAFYITRRAPTSMELNNFMFPHIDTLLKVCAVPVHILYVANFDRSSSTYSLISRASKQSGNIESCDLYPFNPY